MEINRKIFFILTLNKSKLQSEKWGDLPKVNFIYFNWRGEKSCQRIRNIQKWNDNIDNHNENANLL